MLSWMQDLFSAQPPVYARPPTTPTTPAQSSSAATRPQSPGQPPPRPTPPGQPRMNGSYVQQNVNGMASPPGVPVRPRQLVMPGLGSYSDPSPTAGRSEVSQTPMAIELNSSDDECSLAATASIQARAGTTPDPGVSPSTRSSSPRYSRFPRVFDTSTSTRTANYRRQTRLELRYL